MPIRAGQLIAATLLVLAAAPPAAAASLQPLGRALWQDGFEGFGSYSALVVRGDMLLAVSDKGHWAEARLVRDRGDRLAGVETLRHGPLRDLDGQPVGGTDIDAEGIARSPDGTIFVSFEANHRVWSYDRIDGPARALPRLLDYGSLQNNSALEALAIDAAGALYAIPERSGRLERPFPVYRHADGVWSQAGSIPRVGEYLVTGADFAPDGTLWVLERAQRWYGLSSRIRRFARTADGFDAGETLLMTPWGTIGNAEGIEVWTDAAGRTRAMLITDDGGGGLLTTQVLDYLLVE